MFHKIRFTRTNSPSPENYGMTTLELEGPESEIQLKFISKLGKRERRAVIRAFIVQIRPWIEHFTRGAIDHSNDGFIREMRAHARGVSVPKSDSLDSLSGSYGFEIRMKRLELGLTQSTLAKGIGIARSHLSEIERGLYFPHSSMREKLENYLLKLKD